MQVKLQATTAIHTKEGDRAVEYADGEVKDVDEARSGLDCVMMSFEYVHVRVRLLERLHHPNIVTYEFVGPFLLPFTLY